MKTKLLAIALLLGMTCSASAKVTWQGQVVVLALSNVPACAQTNEDVGDFHRAVATPRDLSDNGPNTVMGFFRSRAAYTMKFTDIGADAPFTWIKFNSRGEASSGSGKLVSFSVAPATITEATKTFVLDAKITNWDGANGCIATIRGVFVQRVD